MRRMAASLALCLILILAPLSTVPVAAHNSSEIDAIDDGHALDGESYIETYEEEGVASTEVTSSALTITVAKDSSDVNLSGTHIDSVNNYIRLENENTHAKTFRIYLPADYITPRTKQGLEAEDSDVTMDVRPIRGGTYMELRVRFTGPEAATFKFSKEAGLVFSYVEEYNERLNETSGWQLPSVFGGGEPWEYVPSEEISGERTVFAITVPENESVTVQFDDTPGERSETWLPVPKCGGKDAPVCTFTREDVDDKVYVLSKKSEPPAVRYKYGTDRSEKVKSSLRDIRRGAEKAIDDLKNWLNGDEDGSSGGGE